MARRSYFLHFASALAAALFFLPAEAATILHGSVDPDLKLHKLSAEAQLLSVNILGP